MYSKQYLDYLNSDLWKQRRMALLEKAEFKCRACGENDCLEVHHLTYERLGNEDPNDLVVLCKSHHWMADKERQDPGYIERTLAARPKQEQQPKPKYCQHVKRWHAKAKRIYAQANERGYFTSHAKKSLAELEDKFQSHILRCPVCSGVVLHR